MAASRSSSRCLHCDGLFEADPRNRGRQRFCRADACKQASKRHSQARWLRQPANADYFKGPSNTERVRQWRARNPGYWKRPKKSTGQAAESRSDRPIRQPIASLTPQEPCSPVALQDPSTPPLQDSWFQYSPVLVGLVALQSGSALQEDIRLQLDRLAQNGLAILRHGAGGRPSPNHDRSMQSAAQA